MKFLNREAVELLDENCEVGRHCVVDGVQVDMFRGCGSRDGWMVESNDVINVVFLGDPFHGSGTRRLTIYIVD